MADFTKLFRLARKVIAVSPDFYAWRVRRSENFELSERLQEIADKIGSFILDAYPNHRVGLANGHSYRVFHALGHEKEHLHLTTEDSRRTMALTNRVRRSGDGMDGLEVMMGDIPLLLDLFSSRLLETATV